MENALFDHPDVEEGAVVPAPHEVKGEVFVDELPRSGTQKVQRYRLEAEVAARLDGPLSPIERL